MIALAVVFLVPAYYLAKSKGYNVAIILIASAILSIGVPLGISIINNENPMPWIDITFPFLALGIVWFLPKRAGAPGKAYLNITFECPECKEEVTFPRSKEGSPQLCPKCGEIITVPLDEHSPKPTEHIKEKPDIESGSVCFDSFGDEMSALQLHALLEENGIKSEVIGGIGGGAPPQLGGTEGFKIAIDIDDWERAVEIEKLANQQMDLTPDGAAHP